jgi:small subunit ribosomal protein S15e
VENWEWADWEIRIGQNGGKAVTKSGFVRLGTAPGVVLGTCGPNARGLGILREKRGFEETLCNVNIDNMADAGENQPRKRSFKKFSYRGVDLKDLLDLPLEDFNNMVHARARRKFKRGMDRKPMGLIRKLRKAKAEAGENERPAIVKTHLRDMIVVPEMIGSVIGVYNGKTFNQVEVRPDMVGHYLGEFSITYRPVNHKRPGQGNTGARFIPLR